MRMNDPTAVWPNAGRNCKTRERVNFLGVVGQIEEWMEWEQLCKMFPPPPLLLVPIIPSASQQPITLIIQLSTRPSSRFYKSVMVSPSY